MKKALISALFAIAVCSAQASFLWFTVKNADDGFENVSSWLNAQSLTIDDVYARVVVVNGTGTKTVFDGDYDTAGFVDQWNTDKQQSVDIGELKGDGYSYYIEIVNSNTSSVLGYSAQQTYANMNPKSFTDDIGSIPGITAWHGGGYKATPEPTSAVLMLLGVAGLALRRKQRKADEEG